MRGNFNRTNQRPTLKQRLRQRQDYNRRLAQQDLANRCATCLAALPTPCFTVFGDARRYCSSVCVPRSEAS
jgi:hypothetical protein